MQAINSIDDLKTAIDHLQSSDARFIPVIKAVGTPPMRRREEGFASLVDIIVGQLLSRASADAIIKRMRENIVPYTATGFEKHSDETLLAQGLSRAKVRTFRALSTTISSGELDLNALATLSDVDVAKALTNVKGIGPWTAEIYLLTCLGRADIWPAGDLALQVGVQMVCGLAEKPSAKEALVIADAWRPWRAVAARLVWSYYAHRKQTSVLVK